MIISKFLKTGIFSLLGFAFSWWNKHSTLAARIYLAIVLKTEILLLQVEDTSNLQQQIHSLTKLDIIGRLFALLYTCWQTKDVTHVQRKENNCSFGRISNSASRWWNCFICDHTNPGVRCIGFKEIRPTKRLRQKLQDNTKEKRG